MVRAEFEPATPWPRDQRMCIWTQVVTLHLLDRCRPPLCSSSQWYGSYASNITSLQRCLTDLFLFRYGLLSVVSTVIQFEMRQVLLLLYGPSEWLLQAFQCAYATFCGDGFQSAVRGPCLKANTSHKNRWLMVQDLPPFMEHKGSKSPPVYLIVSPVHSLVSLKYLTT
jgi:hypothetical protein